MSVPAKGEAPPTAIEAPRGGFGVAVAVVLVDSIGYGILVPLLPFLVLHLGGRPALVTQLVAVHALAGFLGGPVIGAWSDRIGRVRAVRLTLIGGVIVYAGLALSWSLAALFLLRAVAGALGGRNGVIRALVTDGIPRDQHASRLGWLTAAGPLGSTLGPLLGAGLGLVILDPVWHFRSAFLVVAALTAITLALTFIAWPGSAPGPSARGVPAGEKGGLRTVAAPLSLNIATSFSYGVILSVTALFVNARFGWREMQTAGLMAVAAVSVTVARAVLSPWFSRRFGNSKSLAICAFTSAPILVIMGFAASPAIFLACFAGFIVISSVAVMLPTIMISVAAPPRQRGYLLGWGQGVAALATAISASLNGVLFDFVGPAVPHLVGAAVLVLAGVLGLVLARTEAARPAP